MKDVFLKLGPAGIESVDQEALSAVQVTATNVEAAGADEGVVIKGKTADDQRARLRRGFISYVQQEFDKLSLEEKLAFVKVNVAKMTEQALNGVS